MIESPLGVSQVKDGKESGQRKDQGYIPMNVLMIQNIMNKGKPYTIGYVEVDNITLVAKVKALSSNIYNYYNNLKSPEVVSDRSGSIDLTLEDETGIIEGKIFKRSGAENIKPILGYEPMQNSYVFIIGSLMNFNGTDLIIVSRIQNVNEYSFVHMHRVQIFWAFLVRNGIIHTCSNDKPINDFNERISQVDNGEFAQLTKEQRIIMEFMKVQDQGKGVFRDDLYCESGLTLERTKQTLDQLVEYGFLYTNAEFDMFYMT